MTSVEKKMVEVLNRTIRSYETVYNAGNHNLAEKIFSDFMAQQKFVHEVTGKMVELEREEDGYIAVLR